jgi:hypothetical protein
MTTVEFLRGVLGSEGYYCILAIKGGSRIQKFYRTVDELDHAAANFDENGYDVYYALATFADGQSREADNVKQLRAMFMDLDCGVNLKTGVSKEFPDQATAITRLRAFCKANNLPKPTLVNSGYGVHVYWPLTHPVDLVTWLPVAEKLKELALSQGFKADKAVTADAARVLRVPGTHNYKAATPALVSVLGIEPLKAVDFDAFASLLVGVATPVSTKRFTPGEAKSPMMEALLGKRESRFKTILEKTAAGRGCAQLQYIIENQDTMSEPLWRAGLSIASCCTDGEKAARLISKGHPEYDEDETLHKMSRIKGPYLCTRFDEYNPGVCGGCQHWNKIKSPVVLGQQFKEATEAESVVEVRTDPNTPKQVYQIPKYPAPYFRGAGGGVFLRQVDEDGDVVEKPVYINDLYVTRRLLDPESGEVFVMRLHLPNDGVREFAVPVSAATSKEKFREIISEAGIFALNKEIDALMVYTQTWLTELQRSTHADVANRQFGWTDDKCTSFVLGDRTIYKDRTELNAPASNTRNLIPFFMPKGTLEGWKETMNFYNKSGFELHQFVVCAGFGSALMHFMPMNAMMIHIWSKDSGFGKTHAQFAAISPWGDPDALLLGEQDTYNTRMNRAEIYRSIPACMDEVTNLRPMEASDLIYQASGGKQRNRLTSSGNVERHRGTPWKLLFITSANGSIIDKVSLAKAMPRAEAQRVLEIETTRLFKGTVSKELTDEFSRSLKSNYGHAGPLFVQYVMQNRELVEQLLVKTQRSIDVAAQLGPENRYWSAACAVTLTAAMICRDLGLLDYDVKALTHYTINHILRMNKQASGELLTSASELLTEYVYHNWGKILQIKSTLDMRGKHNNGIDELVIPDHQPRTDLVGRYETDIKRLYITIKPFREWLSEQQLNYTSVVRELADTLGATKVKARLTKGTRVQLPAADAIVLNIELDVPDNAGDAG